MENETGKSANFGDLAEEHSNFKRAKTVIVPVPYEGTTTYRKGTLFGPRAIIEASAHVETFDDELNQETYKAGIHTMEMIKKVKEITRELVTANKFPVILGGEHSISIGAVSACKEMYEDLTVLYLDAHHDLRDEFNGSKFNHACVARRISEIAPLVEVGMRSLSKDEKEFLSNPQEVPKVQTVTVYDILEDALWKDRCPLNGQPASDFFAAKLIYRLLGYMYSPKRLSHLKKEDKDASDVKEKDNGPKENILHKGGGNPQRGT